MDAPERSRDENFRCVYMGWPSETLRCKLWRVLQISFPKGEYIDIDDDNDMEKKIGKKRLFSLYLKI